MLADYPLFYVARVVLEACTPLSIATGRGNGVFDSLLVRDANKLPAIPGSSFAGVLRHLYREAYGDESARELFGYARTNNQEKDEHDKPSQVHVSWGCIHDRKDSPVSGLVMGLAALSKDDMVLADALQSTAVVRQHVRLTKRGAAAESGQFDRTSLRAGHRFSIELSLWSDRAEDPRWQHLLELLVQPGFRLGGATRRGLGALLVKRIYEGRFDLRKNRTSPPEYKDFAAYRAFQNTALKDNAGLREISKPSSEGGLHANIYITPCNGYRFGQGTHALTQSEDAKLLSVQEKRIVWENAEDATGENGKLTDAAELVIPASSVKGALSHRLTFHHNAVSGCFADTADTPAVEQDKNAAVKALFGYANNDKETKQDNKKYKESKETEEESSSGQAGRVLLDDIYLLPKRDKAFVLTHNSIDRFTGGVRQHVLFSEELVGQKDVLHLQLTVLQAKSVKDKTVREALKLTLKDLTQGRLALGAGGGRGAHGFFSGTVAWSDGGKWIEG